MSAPLIFMDTETTGLALTDDIWEFAAIRREPDGTEERLHLFIDHDPEKAARLPESFRADLAARFDMNAAFLQEEAAEIIAWFLRRDGGDRPHIVGAVPNFDTERLSILLGRYSWVPEWHHHLIDVENLAVGYLHGIGYTTASLTPPWSSDDLSRAVGIDPPTTERHTAMGDALWAMRLYDHITGGAA